jgi:hypothetical protein
MSCLNPNTDRLREEVTTTFANMRPEVLTEMQALYTKHYKPRPDGGLDFNVQDQLFQCLYMKKRGKPVYALAYAYRIPAAYFIELFDLYSKERRRQLKAS